MSQNIVPLKMVVTRDPKVQIMTRREFSIFKGASDVVWKKYVAQSYSPTNFNLSTYPPSPSTVVDRVIYIGWPIKITFTGTNTSALPHLINIDQGLDGFRAFPVAQMTQNLNLTINGQGISQNPYVYMPYLQWFAQKNGLPNTYFSGSPSMLDQFSTMNNPVVNAEGGTSNITATARNQLGNYGSSVFYQNPRNAFVYKSIQQTGATQTTVFAELIEPLFISPLIWGKQNGSGLCGVSTMDWTFTFYNLVQRMWQHVPTANLTLTNANIENDGQPYLLFKYLSLSAIDQIPPAIVYDYNKLFYYLNDQGSPLAPGAKTTNTSLTIQPNAIPRRMYVFVRERDADKYTATGNALNTGVTRPDTFAYISNVSIIWDNRAGIQSSTSEFGLYRTALDNGCQMSWYQWQKQVGSVLCFEFGKDIPLDSSIFAPALQGKYNLQVQVEYTNIYDITTQFCLYVMLILEGTMTIMYPNSCQISEGVITQTDILASGQYPEVSEPVIQNLYGGNLFGKVKSFLEQGAETYRKVKDNPITKVVANVAERLPIVGPAVSIARPILGVGHDDEFEYVMEGGRVVKRKKGKKGRKKGKGVIGGELMSMDQLGSRLDDLLEEDY